MQIRRSVVACTVVVGVLAATVGPGIAASGATERATSYANCTALNKTYPHGVGKRGAVDKTSGTRVTTFTRNNAVYNANTGRDRDKDGIACEKK